MALQFNSFMTGATGIPNGFRGLSMAGTPQIRVYPSTVAYPSTCPDSVASLPAGHIITYTGMTFSASATPGYIVISGATGTTANTTAAGTLSWFAFMNAASGSTQMFISDSIVLTGNNGVLVVNTLTPTNGQSVTISFAMKFTV